MDDPSARCETCKFFRSDDMRCQRFPPHGASWAQVDANSWCGEYHPGPEKPAYTPDSMMSADLDDQQIL